VPEPDEPADLYDLSPAAFTAARDALAKKLKAAGENAEATRVKKLRRPSRTAWALNQVARHRPDMVAAVFAAGASLRQAMEQALAGDPSAMRGAQEAERRALDDAVSAGAAALAGEGQAATEVAKQRMAGTLRAAVVDDAVAADLKAGTLDQDREAPGFGLDAASVSLPAGTERGEAQARRQREAHRAELEAEAERLERRAQRLAAEAEQAVQRAAQARAAAEAAAIEAEQARRRTEEDGEQRRV